MSKEEWYKIFDMGLGADLDLYPQDASEVYKYYIMYLEDKIAEACSKIASLMDI
jgi:hypothetical protein